MAVVSVIIIAVVVVELLKSGVEVVTEFFYVK